MSPFVAAAKNTMLDALTIDRISLHTGHPGTDGLSNEVSGGSYARQACVVNAAAGGTRSLNADVDVPVPAATIVTIGFWDNNGGSMVFHGWAPNGPASNNPQAAYAEATSDEIRLDGHGLSDDDRVFVMPLADAVPGGLSETTLYYVISADADSFQVSLTEGGSAVDITADGDIVIQRCIPEVYAQAGTHTVKSGVSAGL